MYSDIKLVWLRKNTCLQSLNMSNNPHKKLKNCTPRHVRRVGTQIHNTFYDGSDETSSETESDTNNINFCNELSDSELEINRVNLCIGNENGRDKEVARNVDLSPSMTGNYFVSDTGTLSRSNCEMSSSLNNSESSYTSSIECSSEAPSCFFVSDNLSNSDGNSSDKCELLKKKLSEWHLKHNTTLSSLTAMLKL